MQGFLLIDKPEGITSFKVVSTIKRLTKEKRVGHTGTLDPLASGVLPIFLGRATALSGILLEAEKQYTATVKLGVTTDTADITGTVIKENPVSVKREELLSVRVEMLSSPEKDWTVELLAQKARLSPSYFQGIYKKTFGKSPINDLIEARINKAEGYLLSSSKKETEIATLCGYKNVEHFIRQFKGLKGETPSAYKRK